MCSCIPSKNHVKLVNNCYPTGVEKGPKQSELAYLSYYASSRPAKLLKVSAYLEKCLLRDLAKKNWDGVVVALKIFQQLIENCEKDLNLFAKSTTRVTEKCLSQVNEVAWQAGIMFHNFCLHFDAATIGVDEGLTIHMDCLVTKLYELACYDKERTSDQRLLGLYGIYSILLSPLMKTTHSKAYYTKMVYGILNNVTQLDISVDVLKEITAWESRSASEEKGFHESQVNLVALRCLQQLLDSSAPINLFLVVDSAFSYIEKNQLYDEPQFSISLVSFMRSTVASSYRHIIVNEVLRLLNECQIDKVGSKSVTLVKVVESCLNSPTSSVGISVLEYLNSFVGHLRTIHQSNMAEQHQELKRGLLSAITGLGTHLYYTEQVNDMLAFLINKLRSGVDNAPISVSSFELELLQCMSVLVQTNTKPRNDVPLPIITPTLSFLTNESFPVRSEYTRFLTNSLTPVQRTSTFTHTRSASAALADKPSNLRFRLGLHQKLIDYGTREQLDMADYTNIFMIFTKLLDREAGDEFIRALPILFYIHQFSVEPGVVDQFLSDYLLHAGELLNINRLSEYSNHLIQTRKAEGLWCDGTDSSLVQPRKQFVSTDKVRGILRHQSHLKHLFADLNDRLDVIYDPKSPSSFEFIHSEPPKSKLVSKMKHPKLAVPIMKSIDAKPVNRLAPQVEHFKDALKANSASSICEEDSDSSDFLTGSYYTVKRSKSSRTDLSILLKSVSAHSLASSTSLVDSPHRT